MRGPRAVRVGWLIAAGLVALVAVLLALTWRGECADAGPEWQACTTEPVLGVAGTWVMAGVAGAFIVVAVVKAFRRKPR